MALPHDGLGMRLADPVGNLKKHRCIINCVLAVAMCGGGAYAEPALIVNHRLPHTAPVDRSNVFVTIETHITGSQRMPHDVKRRVTALVAQQMAKTGYATTWPSPLPTEAELGEARYRAFIVSANVKKVAVERVGARVDISCTIGMRVAAWHGIDGGERWDASTTANAAGSARTTTGNRADQIEHGVCACIESAIGEASVQHVVPFLQRVASAD